MKKKTAQPDVHFRGHEREAKSGHTAPPKHTDYPPHHGQPVLLESRSYDHSHTCPKCGHTWRCIGIFNARSKTCELLKGIKTNGGLCYLCFHLDFAEVYAKHRWPEEGEHALARAMFERTRRLAKEREEQASSQSDVGS